MNKKIILSLLVLISFAFVSCERYPISHLNDLPATVMGWPNPWYLYDDSLNTKGSFEPFFWGNIWNDRTGGFLSFACTDNPARGTKCIKFQWNRLDPSKTYCGFGMSSTQDLWDMEQTKDMSTSAYKYLKFKAKGSLTTGCELVIEIPLGKGGTGTQSSIVLSSELTNTWQDFEIAINSDNKSFWQAQKYYFAIALRKGNGGTVYIDDIRFER